MIGIIVILAIVVVVAVAIIIEKIRKLWEHTKKMCLQKRTFCSYCSVLVRINIYGWYGTVEKDIRYKGKRNEITKQFKINFKKEEWQPQFSDKEERIERGGRIERWFLDWYWKFELILYYFLFFFLKRKFDFLLRIDCDERNEKFHKAQKYFKVIDSTGSQKAHDTGDYE